MMGKALALISGGLDSTLAVGLVKEMGVEVEGVHFTTPFCQCDKCSVDKVGEQMGIRVHHAFMGEEFIDIVVNPPHGHGSQMNVCLDCRIMMMKKAKELAKKLGAGFLVSGEVLGQRPFSQHGSALKLIEREAGVEGLVLRPLSGKLLAKTMMEEEGIIDRSRLEAIKGRRRLPQMELAKKLGVYDYPCPSGGCLLTDIGFSQRLREYIGHEGKPTLEAVMLLKLGRHFRFKSAKIVVGRNHRENMILEGFAKLGFITLTVAEFNGPTTITRVTDDDVLLQAARITAKYSDAPKNEPVTVIMSANGNDIRMTVKALNDDELERIRTGKEI